MGSLQLAAVVAEYWRLLSLRARTSSRGRAVTAVCTIAMILCTAADDDDDS